MRTKKDIHEQIDKVLEKLTPLEKAVVRLQYYGMPASKSMRLLWVKHLFRIEKEVLRKLRQSHKDLAN